MRISREAQRVAFALSGLLAPLGIMGLALSGCGAPQASRLPPTGRIAFASNRAPAGIYAIDADGSDLEYLGGQPAAGVGPRWSPEGAKLAVQSWIRSDFQIEVFNADGSDRAVLGEGTDPEWSPDGQHIAYVYYPEDNGEIYTMRADGSERERLTTAATDDWVPKWSPDGLRIVFVSVENATSVVDKKEAIEIINNDGADHTVIRTGRILGWPVWSPDGEWIAYVSEAGLQVIRPNGSHEMTLASNASGGHEPAWSPDGTQIAYVCLGKSPSPLRPDICMVDADGQHVRRLTGNFPGGSGEFHPSWSPDGEWIAFCASEPHFDIYVMADDGSSQKNLTDDSPADLAPAWKP